MLGALFSLLSAATFGLNAASLRRGVITGSVLQAMAITVPAGVPLFALGCLAFGAFDALLGFSVEALGWFAAAGVVHFIVGRYGNYRATRVLGAAQSGPIQQVALLISLALAIVFLGERLQPVVDALLVARRARALMRQNLGFALVYNLFAVPLAFLGYVTPLVAALAMSGSSTIVTLNALRARLPARTALSAEPAVPALPVLQEA